MKFRSIFFLAGFFSIVSASAALAETVYLKNGTTVEGRIILEEPSRIQVDVGGIPKTIFRAEIDRIAGGAGGETLADLQAKDLRALQDIPESKKLLINRLLAANGARENMNKTLSQVLASAPAESQNMLRDMIKIDDLITQIVPLYDKYYTEAELKEMVAFYSSPTGKKLIEVMPHLMKHVVTITAAYFKSKTPPVPAK